MQIKTKGYIIKSYDWREYDRRFLLFSEKFGKLMATARGVKKLTSKMSGNLQLFREIEFTLVPNKDSYIIIGTKVIHTYNNLICDTYATHFIWACLGILQIISAPHQQVLKIYAGFKKALFLAEREQKQENYSLIFWGFVAKVIYVLGFLPHLDSCVECHKNSSNQFIFSIQKGGILCKKCAFGMKIEEYIKLDSASFAFLKATIFYEMEELIKIVQIGNAGIVLEKFIEYHLGKQIPILFNFQ